MEGSVEDIGAPPDSWEVADLDATMSRLLISSSSKKESSSSSSSSSTILRSSSSSSTSSPELVDVPTSASWSSAASASSAGGCGGGGGVSEDIVNSVDQFLREALQNPRERLSVLRMEQDVEKFIRDPTQQQMEFQQLPTSYLRLAAHRVAQHYFLQSMVLLDTNLPDGSGSRIIVRKTSECRLPPIRLADIPVNIPTEDTGVAKVAIKQRPQKRSQSANNANSHSLKSNGSKSVEERKEEYNRARARIFNSSSSGSFNGVSGVKPESELRVPDSFQHASLGIPKIEEKSVPGGSVNSGRGAVPGGSDVNSGRGAVPGGSDVNSGRGVVDSSTGSSRSAARSRTEKEPVGRFKTNNRVAIFRDRDVERKDPDYDRNYDRYTQRFDPGFGFNGGLYTIQPMYSPAVNYNTEFPQLGVHRPPISTEHQPRPLLQHLPRPWAGPPSPAGIGYGHPETMMTQFSPNHVGARSTSALYLHSTQYPCQHPGMQFIHPHEQVHQSFSQAHQQLPDTSFGLARPR